jgi:hypothetical protein
MNSLHSRQTLTARGGMGAAWVGSGDAPFGRIPSPFPVNPGVARGSVKRIPAAH